MAAYKLTDNITMHSPGNYIKDCACKGISQWLKHSYSLSVMFLCALIVALIYEPHKLGHTKVQPLCS